MRVLLDEDLDVRLRHHFAVGIDVVTVQHRGWKGLNNGRLLAAAEAEFDALVTGDDSLLSQQNLAQFDLALLILRARSKALGHLIELMPQVQELLPKLRSGKVLRIFLRNRYPTERPSVNCRSESWNTSVTILPSRARVGPDMRRR